MGNCAAPEAAPATHARPQKRPPALAVDAVSTKSGGCSSPGTSRAAAAGLPRALSLRRAADANALQTKGSETSLLSSGRRGGAATLPLSPSAGGLRRRHSSEYGVSEEGVSSVRSAASTPTIDDGALLDLLDPCSDSDGGSSEGCLFDNPHYGMLSGLRADERARRQIELRDIQHALPTITVDSSGCAAGGNCKPHANAVEDEEEEEGDGVPAELRPPLWNYEMEMRARFAAPRTQRS